MKQAPFSLTIIILVICLIAFIIGCLLAWILGLIGVTGGIGLFLSGFGAFLIAGYLRPWITSYFAEKEGVTGPVPTAFNLGTRLLIGALIALGLTFLLNLNGGSLGFGVIQGGLIGLLTAMIATLVFSSKMMMGK